MTKTETTVMRLDGYTKKMREFRVIGLETVKSWAIGLTKMCRHDVPGNIRTVPCAFCDEQIGFHQDVTEIYPYGNVKTHMYGCSQFICGRCNGVGSYHVDTTPSHVWFVANDGVTRRAKVNGKVRTWKRDQARVELPLKYGLYEYATFTAADIEGGRLLEEI